MAPFQVLQSYIFVHKAIPGFNMEKALRVGFKTLLSLCFVYIVFTSLIRWLNTEDIGSVIVQEQGGNHMPAFTICEYNNDMNVMAYGIDPNKNKTFHDITGTNSVPNRSNVDAILTISGNFQAP